MAHARPQNDDKERVREASDITDVIGRHLTLHAKGNEYVCLCPFHDDHKPSMTVVPRKQIYHCFVCGAGGDIFDFVQNYLNMSFRESLEHLAEQAGIELTRSGAQPTSGPSSRTLADANKLACEFFRSTLAHPTLGSNARTIIERRGISPDMVDAFQLGVAPAGWDGLLTELQRKRIDPGAFLEGGLLRKRQDGSGAYDYFRNRLMFPIQDQAGRVIAFGARKIDEQDEPKYLNSPETRLFDKSSTLFGLFQASRSIQHDRTAIVTEGYTDVIACHQAGFTNAVATLGTALTNGHAKALSRICDTVILLFDSDEAGRRAAERAVEVFFASTIDVRIATLAPFTDAKDPDELLKREDGDTVFREALDGSIDLLDFQFRRMSESISGAGISARARLLREFCNRLAELGVQEVDPLRRRYIIRHVAEIASVPFDEVIALLPGGRRPRVSGRGEPAPDARPEERLDRRPLSPAEHVLACVLADAQLLVALDEAARDSLGPDAYASPVLKRIADTVLSLAREGDEPDLRNVLSRTDDPGERQAATALVARIDRETDGDPGRLHEHFSACLKHLERENAPAGEDLIARIEHKRQQMAKYGPNQRALPRPLGPS